MRKGTWEWKMPERGNEPEPELLGEICQEKMVGRRIQLPHSSWINNNANKMNAKF